MSAYNHRCCKSSWLLPKAGRYRHGIPLRYPEYVLQPVLHPLDGDKASVSCTVTGEKILSVGRTCKDTLPQTVCRVCFIRDFVGFFLLAEKALDFLDAFGIGSRNHFRHFHDQWPYSLRNTLSSSSRRKSSENHSSLIASSLKKRISCTLPTDQAKHHFKLAAGMKHPFDRSK